MPFKESQAVLNYMRTCTSLPFESKVTRALKINGVYANFVFRLTFENGSTAIFKYYATHLAIDESFQVSQNRYFIEKNALLLLASDDSRDSSLIINTPRLLHFDDTHYVMIMEDCGENLLTLTDLFKNECKQSNHEGDKKSINDFLSRLARDVAKFLKRLSSTVLTSPDVGTTSRFANQSYWEAINGNFMKVALSVAQQYEIEKELKPHLDYYKSNVFQPPKQNACFIHGDFWSNVILVDLPKQKAWIVDWETARFDTEYRDLEEMCFVLWTLKENTRHFNKKLIDHFSKELQKSYFERENVDWREMCGEHTKMNMVLMLVFLLAFQNGGDVEWKLDNPRELALKALNELEKF